MTASKGWGNGTKNHLLGDQRACYSISDCLACPRSDLPDGQNRRPKVRHTQLIIAHPQSAQNRRALTGTELVPKCARARAGPFFILKPIIISGFLFYDSRCLSGVSARKESRKRGGWSGQEGKRRDETRMPRGGFQDSAPQMASVDE
jgi:hypothetical protein